MRYIKDIQEGENIAGHYFCKQKQMLKSRAGKSYLSIKLQDKTGTIDAKVWDMHNDIHNFEECDFIKIEATALIYQNEYQLNIRKLRKSSEGEYHPEDYIPTTEKNVGDMYTELVSYVKTIQNPYLKRLLEEFFVKDQEVIRKFCSHSAAKNVHHGYMGGLMEHTLSVVQICDFMSKQYKVNRDLLITSAMFHDMGKIEELSEFPVNDYTDDGQLLGHIIIGTEMITDKVREIPGFPKELASILKHSILSHHGEYEYGSPKRPKTIEALILHCADNLDAKVKIFEEAIQADNTQGSWVGYHKLFARNLRKTDI